MKGRDFADCIYCPGVARKSGSIYTCSDCGRTFTDDDIILKTYEKVNSISADNSWMQPD